MNPPSKKKSGRAKSSAETPKRATRNQAQTPPTDGYLTGDEAIKILGIKRQTLYSYASRGLLRSMNEKEGRAHVYAREDVEKLKARSLARAGHGPVAASALRWGEPVLETAVSTIDVRGPIYRGVPAITLCERGASFEDAAALLWGESQAENVIFPEVDAGLPAAGFADLLPKGASPLNALVVGIPLLGVRTLDRALFPPASWPTLGRALLRRMAALVSLPDRRERFARALGEKTIARAALTALGGHKSSAAIRAVDRALLLCADHELNPSTFGARVAASAGADMFACVSAGLSVLTGPEHGGVCDRVEALVRETLVSEGGSAAHVGEQVARRAARGDPIPGFGHALYRAGDPRAPPLFEAAEAASNGSETLAAVRAIVKAMAAAGREPPTVDMGLVAVACAVGLPQGGAACLFAIGRAAGWIAHAMEQRNAGYIVRPRARYVGPPSQIG